MVFQLRREALLIHFIHFMLGHMPRAGDSPASLLFFARVAFVGRFSPWFQLYGEALLIHFYLRRFLRRASEEDFGGFLFSTMP